MLTAPSGAAGFIARHHTAALSAVAGVAGFATAAATASAVFQSIIWMDVATLALGALLAAAISFWHLRHPVLAAFVAATPLPGLIWAAPLSAGSHFGLVPIVAYGFGFALATLYAQRMVDLRLNANDSETPWRTAGMMLALAIGFAFIWFDRRNNGEAALQAVGDLVGVSVSVLLFLPLLVPFLRFDEDFIADANRAREWRGRICERLSVAAIPRWGLSFTGIALVFLALAWFGAGTMLRPGWWRYAVTIVFACSVLGTIAGGWREGVGLGLVLTLVSIVALWWRSYDAHMPFGAVAVLEMTILAGVLALSGARRMRVRRASGEALEIVRRRALEGSSGAVFAALGAAAAAVPSLLYPGAIAIVLSLFAAGLCGALLFPAILTAVETLLPHRRSVEDVFDKVRRP